MTDDPRDSLDWALIGRRFENEVFLASRTRGAAMWLHLPNGARTQEQVIDLCSGVPNELPMDRDCAAAASSSGETWVLAKANGYRQPFFGRPEEYADLLTDFEALASESGWTPVLTNLDPHDPIVGILGSKGYVFGVTDANAVIDLPGSSMKDWLASFRAKRRWGFLNEIDAVSRTDRFALRGDSALPMLAEASRLAAATAGSHGLQSDALACQRIHDRYRRYASTFGNRFVLRAIAAEGEMLAQSCWIEGNNLAYNAGFGMFGDLAKQLSAYFNVVYYQPIEDSYRSAIRQLFVGPGTTGVKVRRGARLSPLLTAVPKESALRPLLLHASEELLADLTRQGIELATDINQPRATN